MYRLKRLGEPNEPNRKDFREWATPKIMQSVRRWTRRYENILSSNAELAAWAAQMEQEPSWKRPQVLPFAELEIERHKAELLQIITWREDALRELRSRALKTALMTKDYHRQPQRKITGKPPASRTGPAVSPSASWQDMEIIFLSDERVRVCRGQEQKTYNYGEMGFEDKRNGKPNSAWVLLREMAESDGAIPRPNPGKDKGQKQKRIQEIRKRLKAHFRIDAEPVRFHGETYKASFKIYCALSSDT